MNKRCDIPHFAILNTIRQLITHPIHLRHLTQGFLINAVICFFSPNLKMIETFCLLSRSFSATSLRTNSWSTQPRLVRNPHCSSTILPLVIQTRSIEIYLGFIQNTHLEKRKIKWHVILPYKILKTLII